jgi:hypothetical protein
VTHPALFPWWSVLVEVLAAARFTRLLAKDHLPPIKNTREGLLRYYRGSQWATLWVCPWCLGFWIVLIIFGLHLLLGFLIGPDAIFWYVLVLAPWAMSYVVGFLAEYEGA